MTTATNTKLMISMAIFFLLSAHSFAQNLGHTTTWTREKDLAGFEPGEGGNLVWVALGGNSGGFIKTVKTGQVVPKPYLRNDLRRVFGTGAGTISFDLKVLGDNPIPGCNLFLSTGTQAFSYTVSAKKNVGHDQSPADGWVHYTIPWKGDWTEAQARAQGWHPFSGDVDKWVDVLANPVYTTLSVGENVGIDNFRIEAGQPLNAANQKMIEPPPPQKTAVVHFAFDEGSGDVLHDRTGNAADAAIRGAKWVRHGGRWALEFDGQDAFVNFGPLNVVGPQTLVAWIYADPIYSVWQSVPIMNAQNLSVSQTCRNGVWAGGAYGFLPYEKWVHLAVVWDGKTVRLYVDGTLVNYVAGKEPVAGGQDFLVGAPHILLPGEPPEYDRRFKGKMAALEFFNRALSQEDVLEDLRTSNITNSPMSMSIPLPGFDQIKVEVDAARLGKPLDRVTVSVDVLKSGAGEGQPLVSAVVKEFDKVGRAVVDLSVPDLAPGDYLVHTTARDAADKMLGVAGDEPLSWVGSAQFPSGPDGARKLNNLVTELLRVPGPDRSGTARSFVNPRAGFIYISNLGSKEIKIKADAEGESFDLVLSQDYGEAAETMRYLPKGRYTITTLIAKDLIVRAIAETVLDFANTVGVYVHGFGPYDGQFEARYVLPHMTTFMVQDGDFDSPFAKEWKAKGRRLLADSSTDFKARPGQSDVDALCEKLSVGLGFNHPLSDGYLVDEFAASSEGHWVWAQGLERLLSEPRLKGRAVHAWTYAYYDLVTYFGGAPGKDFLRTLKKFDSPVQWECYLDSQRTELNAWRHIHDKLVGEMQVAERVSPGAVASLIVAPYAGVTSGPPWLTMTLPSYDVRTNLEMQVRTVATHPSFAGVRGLGVYRSPYLDEEVYRWMSRVFRHYAIEGRTEPLGKDPFLLTHIHDGDFEEPSAAWWTLDPAEEGSIAFGMHPALGSLESRYTGRNGDAVLITRRSDKAANAFSQEINNLEPGRLYSFRMFSADHRDMSKNEAHALTVQFDHAELVPEKCFTHLAATRTYANRFLNWHVRVFRAKGKTATLRISDWGSDKEPGGPIGQELAYNFLKIQPYWPAD